MNIETNFENNEEIVVRAFKIFLKKVIKHSAIDYARKIKAKGGKEVFFSDLIESKVSLSVTDSGTFFAEEKVNYKRLENIMQKESHKKAITLLTEREKKILYMSAEGYSNKEIAKTINTTENCVRVTKSNAKNKIIRKVEELENE